LRAMSGKDGRHRACARFKDVAPASPSAQRRKRAWQAVYRVLHHLPMHDSAVWCSGAAILI